MTFSQLNQKTNVNRNGEPQPQWSKMKIEVLEKLSQATLEAFIASSPCIACGAPPLSDIAHVRSRGSGGPSAAWNMIPFCRKTHALQHQVGWTAFLKTYPAVKFRLFELGWEIFEVNGRLWHPGLRVSAQIPDTQQEAL